MRRGGWLPGVLLAALLASYGFSAAVSWWLLRHFDFTALQRGGFTVIDPGALAGINFRQYFAGRFFVWDAQWYDVIARVGYVWQPTATERQSLAFFPLWGLMLRPIYRLTEVHQHLLAVMLTVVIAYAAIDQFFRLGVRLIGPRAAAIATVLYVAYPAAHFLLQSYPTGLMNLIALLVLRDVIDGREWRPALLAGIGTAAGPLMVVPGFTVWLVALWRRRERLLQPRVLLLLLGLGVLALSGLIAFVGWQAVALHDPFAFLAAQRPWDQSRGLASRLWRFVWMTLILPDFYHIGWLGHDFVHFMRTGQYFWAFVRFEFAMNFFFRALLMIGLFWTISIKPRAVPLYGVLVMLFYIFFHGTKHGGFSMMRLIYICAPAFWGLGRALQREPVWAWGTAIMFTLALIAQEIFSDIGQLVL